MSTSAQLVSVLLVALAAGCVSSRTGEPGARSDEPVIVIRRYPDYPAAGRDSEYPGGLVVALWRDGRMIRPAHPAAVGKSYVEGIVPARQREKFFAFLSTNIARAPKAVSIPMHMAYETISIRDHGTSEWTRVLPDTESVWREIESRLRGLPLDGSHSVDSSVVQGSSWY